MTTFGEQMRKLADIAATANASSLPSKQMTDADRAQIKQLMLKNIEEEARKGNYRCNFRLDTYERADDKDKGTQLENKLDKLLIKSMQEMGVAIVYRNNMYCGMCEMNDCDENAHYGYGLSWS